MCDYGHLLRVRIDVRFVMRSCRFVTCCVVLCHLLCRSVSLGIHLRIDVRFSDFCNAFARLADRRAILHAVVSCCVVLCCFVSCVFGKPCNDRCAIFRCLQSIC